MKKLNTPIALTLVGLASVSCSQSGSSGSDLDQIPAVAPIVNSAAPTALKATSSAQNFMNQLKGSLFSVASIFQVPPALASPTAPDIAAQLTSIFKGNYVKISSGSTGTGYINALLEDLDYRMNELKSRFSGQTVSCMSRSSQTVGIDLSSIFSGFSLSLDVQCNDHFGGAGDQSFSGSGMLFGQSSSSGDYSLWLGLNHSASDGFGYAARVKNPTTDTKEVDMIFIDAGSLYSRASIARLKAKPSTQNYELVYRSTGSNSISPMSGGSTISVGYAIDLISDGTNIYVQGMYTGSPGTSCGSSTAFSACLSATDLSTSTGCATLSNSFTIASQSDLTSASCLTIPMPSDSEKTLFNAIQISNGDSKTGAVSGG